MQSKIITLRSEYNNYKNSKFQKSLKNDHANLFLFKT